MDTITTQPDTGLDWTDQVRTVARFIADHDLPVVALEARPSPSRHHNDCHVHVHVMEGDWLAWWPRLERIIDEHTEEYPHVPDAVFHYVVTIVAGVRVNLLYLTDAKPAVA